MSLFGIVLGLALLIFLAFKGQSILWVAPVCAAVVALLSMFEDPTINVLSMWTDNYMAAMATFLQTWFPAFMLGAIFGKVMEISGAAKSVGLWLTKLIGAKQAMLATVIACAVLTYGGISLFVVVFAIYPLAVALYREADIPNKLIPGAISLGAFTFTMTAIPGTPQIQNIIPTKYYGTTAMAAPIMGIIAALVMLVLGVLWMKSRENKLKKEGLHFVEPSNVETISDDGSLPNPIVSLIPLVSVPVTLNALKFPLVGSLLLAVVLAIVLNLKAAKDFPKAINDGAAGGLMSIGNTAAANGFGGVVKAVPGFATLTTMLLGVPGTPLISEAIAVSVLAGATGSASGGMGIALEALGPKYMELAANDPKLSPEALHRVASVASGGLDTLPHNGAVITLLSVCGLTHKDSYIDIGMNCCVIPTIAVIICIIFAMFGIC
ncbi:GntP family permease [Frisingicoccus caecimuris]|uniref:H+/gluconate symporter-like permease n=1 Tax=Frisingicoccus caecimuris TaxID=1796636 RepID=A0A4R2LHI7_9FIRM|nr:GntP family permease [Frisingicoccus caecimuris]MCR1919099.1 GntP family permease [Frisingicoccus caecimuris]TCO84575.1 H+/gluconate symporter-like permease [Frisingicoccus caecimuris]